jgi:cell division protein FtsB
MSTRQRKKSILKRFYMPLATGLVLTYFGYHAFHGDYGLMARAELDSQVSDLEGELKNLRTIRRQFEHRVSLLRPESLDPDMVDELARANLNLSHPNEITIMLNH